MSGPLPAELAAACAFEYYCGPGPGGQRRNKKLTGVRARHLASGLFATCSHHRSREQNRRAALASLAAKLERAARRPAPRRPTVPGRGARERRLAEKRARSRIRQTREKVRGDEQ